MRVLVVDDHLPTIELMRMTLTAYGHSVATATNVADALELVAAQPPDIVLSDLSFGGDSGAAKGGFALARAMRADPACAGIGLVAITGTSSAVERQAALDSGFDDVVVKPFDVESLIQRITELAPDAGAR